MPNWIPLNRQGLQQDGLGQPQLQMKQPEVDYSIQDLPVFDPVYNPEYLRDFRGYDSDPLTVLDQTLAAPVRTGLKRLAEAERAGQGPLKTFRAGLGGAWEGLTTAPSEGVTGKDVAREWGVSDRSMKQGKYAEMYPDMSLADLAGFGIEAGAEIPLGAGLFAGAGAKGFKKAGRKFSSLVDRKQRFEIPDNLAKIKNLESLKKGYGTQLGKLLEHDELYKNYPELKKMRVVFDEYTSGASYSDLKKEITIGTDLLKSPKKLKETLLHEIQHNMQDVSGFARGGSPEMFMGDATRELNKVNHLEGVLYSDVAYKLDDAKGDIKKIMKIRDEYPEEYKQVNDALKYLKINNVADAQKKVWKMGDNIDPVEKYKHLAGEAESDDVMARMDFTEKQLMSTQPGSSHGYGLDELIVRDADGPMMSTRGKGLADDLAGKRVVHGSPYKFEKFDINKIGTGSGKGLGDNAIWFTNQKDDAIEYASGKTPENQWPVSQMGQKPSGYLYKANLKMKDPLVVYDYDMGFTPGDRIDALKQAKKEGKSGVEFRSGSDKKSWKEQGSMSEYGLLKDEGITIEDIKKLMVLGGVGLGAGMATN